MSVWLTVLETIMQAGGFDTRKAEASNVVITRHKPGKGYGWALDFRDALVGKEFKSFYLEPLDIVYIPPDKIKQVANWIDQHINQMIPRIGFSWNKDIGGGTTSGITAPPTIVTQP